MRGLYGLPILAWGCWSGLEVLGVNETGDVVFSDSSSHSVWTPVETDVTLGRGCTQDCSLFDALIHGSMMSLLGPAGGILPCTISTPLSDNVLPAADVFLRGYEAWVKHED